MLPKGYLKNLDKGLLLSVVCLVSCSLFFLYYIGGAGGSYYFSRQSIWICAACVAGFVSLALNYKLWERFSWMLYFINIFLLVVLLVVGKSTMGAESWIEFGFFKVQPSEFAKILFIITFASFLARYRREINRPPVLALALAQFLLPFGLILLQPDMGTALVFMAIFFGMLYVSGIEGPILLLTSAGFVSAGIALVPFVIKEYQLKRLTSFLSPETDPLGSGYQLIQSKIAIGSGGLLGKGIGEGAQASLGFLPTSQSDFIFAAICEQTGLIGAVIIILLFFWFMYRVIRIAGLAEDLFAVYIAAGIFSMIAFQAAVNIGMSVGLFPITGIPLPFISYGGSSMLMNAISVGLLLNIAIRRRKIMFV